MQSNMNRLTLCALLGLFVSTNMYSTEIRVIDRELVHHNHPVEDNPPRPVPYNERFLEVSGIPSLERSIEVPFPWGKENLYISNRGHLTGNVYREPGKPWIVQLGISTPGKGDTRDGSPHYKVWYRVSNDDGKTYSELRQVVVEGEDYSIHHPIEGVEVGRNGFNIDATRPIIGATNDEIMVPVCLHPWDEENDKPFNPVGTYTYQDVGVLIGKWFEDGSDIEWSFGEWLRIDHNLSTRGLSEPTIAELGTPGHFALVARGANNGRPELPGYAWVAFSEDYCRTWSDPRPLTYSDGGTFYVPAAHSTLIRSRYNGRLYWIGNLLNSNPDGSHPRHPLVIGEIDENNFGLIRESVVQIDTRNPELDPEWLQLSNFAVMENPQSGELLIQLRRLGRSGHDRAPGLSWYLLSLTASDSGDALTWTHDTFEDFQQGTLGNAGHNLYVSQDGRVQTIRRFDINQNGHLDLIFNSTHDWYHEIPATLVSFADNERKAHSTPVAVPGSSGVIARDLNNNGHIDLLFKPNRLNLQHPRNSLSIAWGGEDGWPAHRITRMLPVYRPRAVAIADMNRNGWPDIVTLNGKAWMPTQPEGNIVRIYWGGPNGFQLQHFMDFSADEARDLVTGDLNGDGHDSIAAVSPEGVLYIIHSSEEFENRETVELKRYALRAAVADRHTHPASGDLLEPDLIVQALAIGDLNGDGSSELILGTDGDSLLMVSFGSDSERATRVGPASHRHGRYTAGNNRLPGSRIISAFPASQITIADLDGDGFSDLILTDLSLGRAMGGEDVGAVGDGVSAIQILWGAEDGYSSGRSKAIPVAHAIATAVGDYDGDGIADLAIAVHQSEITTAAESLVYFGSGNRRFAEQPATVQTEGAMHPGTVPPTQGHPERVVFCNSLGGTLGERVPLYIYWGTEDGFSSENLWEMPFRSGYKSLAADLHANGHVDLVVINSGHGLQPGEVDPELGAHIYWGGPKGETPGPNKFDLERRAILTEYGLGTTNVADLNKNGYLDLVLGSFGSRDQPDAELVIYYGSADGFTADNRVALKNENRTIGTLVADFDNDGWLDIAVVAYLSNKATLFFGGPEGFSEENRQDIHTPAPIDIEAADLNGNGWLDLIVSSYKDTVADHFDSGMTIFWGGPDGYQNSNAQWLPSTAAIGIAVADLDDDGYLDIIVPNYHAEQTREDIPSYIYWGSPDGFSVRNRTSLIVDSAHDVLVGDFNGNGLKDLAFSAHSRNDTHLIDSPIFFNDGNRFANPEIQYLPTVGTHWMNLQDVGNIADRSYVETYESPVMTWQDSFRNGKIAVDADVPPGSRLTLQVRSSRSTTTIDSTPWSTVDGGVFDLAADDRVLQYKILFESANGDRFPILNSVSVSLPSP